MIGSGGLTKIDLLGFREFERETKRSIVTFWIPHSKRSLREREEAIGKTLVFSGA
jgi:hypothetical protein